MNFSMYIQTKQHAYAYVYILAYIYICICIYTYTFICVNVCNIYECTRNDDEEAGTGFRPWLGQESAATPGPCPDSAGP